MKKIYTLVGKEFNQELFMDDHLLKIDWVPFCIKQTRNINLEKSIDPLWGKEVIPNRYDTFVSGMWVQSWLDAHKINIKEEHLQFLNDALEKEKAALNLVRCFPYGADRALFLSILLCGNQESLAPLILILEKANLLNYSLVFKHHRFLCIFDESFNPMGVLEGCPNIFSYEYKSKKFSFSFEHLHRLKQILGINVEPSSIKTNLKRFRRRQGITQIKMANRLGIPVHTYRRYENNHYPIPDSIVKHMSEILGIDKSFLS